MFAEVDVGYVDHATGNDKFNSYERKAQYKTRPTVPEWTRLLFLEYIRSVGTYPAISSQTEIYSQLVKIA